MTVIIRDLRLLDIEATSNIVRDLWGDDPADKVIFEMEEMFRNTKFPPHYFVAEKINQNKNNQIVGFTGLRPCLIFPDTFECIWINVMKKYQGYGIGRDLNLARLRKIEELGGKLTLVMTKNLEFFEKFNFQKIQGFNDGWCLMSLRTGDLKL